MIKYIGSKRALLGHVTGAVAGVLPQGGRVCDLFSGTARVGHALKKQGFQVWSNDLNAYAHALATAYVQADRELWVDSFPLSNGLPRYRIQERPSLSRYFDAITRVFGITFLEHTCRGASVADEVSHDLVE